MKLPDLYADKKRMAALEGLVVELLRKLGGRVEVPYHVIQDTGLSHEITTDTDLSTGTTVLKLTKSGTLAEIAARTPIRTPLESKLYEISCKEQAAEVKANNEELAKMWSDSALFDGWVEGNKKSRESEK